MSVEAFDFVRESRLQRERGSSFSRRHQMALIALCIEAIPMEMERRKSTNKETVNNEQTLTSAQYVTAGSSLTAANQMAIVCCSDRTKIMTGYMIL